MALKKQDMSQPWYGLPVDEIFRKLETTIDGLSENEAELRLKKFGLNKLPEEEKTPTWIVILNQFKDPLIYILLIASIITVILRDYVDAAVIFGVVLLNAVIGFTQEYKAKESIQALAKMLALRATVARSSYERDIDAETIVPGDIVLLQSGQKVPADIRLIQAKEFQVEESSLTGESETVVKTVDPISGFDLQPFEQKNMVFTASTVASGRGVGVTVATGRNTQLGQISEEVRSVGSIKTPLQDRVEVLSNYIIIVTVAFSVVGLIVGVMRGENLRQLMLAIIALAVAVVPEGLPIALTISLAVAVNRMAKKNAIIRFLPAIETLGSSTVVGSDKTGTLTRNEMSVRKIWAGTKTYSVDGTGYEPVGKIMSDSSPITIENDKLLTWTLRIGLLANESALIMEDSKWKAHGDPTEVALITAAYRGMLDEEKERIDYARLDILPFESEYQFMATLNKFGDKCFVLVKGAPEKLLSLSKSIASEDNDVEIQKATVIDTANSFADQGLRVLGMAYKELPPGTTEITHNDVFDLTFAGLQGMLDPPRPEAIEAVKNAVLSGIRVIMITGDNPRTALSIGRAMGIAGMDDKARSGRELDGLDDENLESLVKTIPVFARVSPYHKLKIVNALKANGEIVAITGDGVNDAAALKAAHIGIAMGLTGTDVAK
ncbi:MAG: HAD-IC family P-type ATPase, partial [Rubrobacteridae bacterium]|nr:HAD-IC family P-type ATPase [Rubrobacteridae bacterium]